MSKLINMYKDKITQLLLSDNSIEKLKEFAIELNNDGKSKNEIYQIFYETHLELQEKGFEEKADMLGDVMDMFTGWFSPFNFNLDE